MKRFLTNVFYHQEGVLEGSDEEDDELKKKLKAKKKKKDKETTIEDLRERFKVKNK